MKLTQQQMDDLRWVAEHRGNIVLRNKFIDDMVAILLWITASIGNYGSVFFSSVYIQKPYCRISSALLFGG